MPSALARPCAINGCSRLTTNKLRFCDTHLQQRQQQTDQQRGTTSERGYNARWQHSRLQYLHANPLCIQCIREGVLRPATTVDHIKPHRGDYDLMWNTSNYQSLCTQHHSIKTAKEDGGFGNKETRG